MILMLVVSISAQALPMVGTGPKSTDWPGVSGMPLRRVAALPTKIVPVLLILALMVSALTGTLVSVLPKLAELVLAAQVTWYVKTFNPPVAIIYPTNLL